MKEVEASSSSSKKESSREDAPLLSELPNSKRRLLLGAMYLSAVTSMVFSGTDSVLLPKAAEEFGALDYYSVAMPLSSIVTIVMMPLSGFLMARNPTIKVKLFVGEWVMTIIGGVIMAVAQNYAMIVVGMMLARMCFPAVYVCGFTIIRELYDAKQAGVYMGLMNTVMLGSNIVVPTFGGAIVDGFGWRWMYVIMAVAAAVPAVVAVLSNITYPERARDYATNSPFDAIGLISLVVTMGGFIPFVALGRSLVPFGTPLSWAFLVIAIVGCIALAFAIKKKGDESILPVGVLKDRNVLCFFLGNFTNNFAILSCYLFLPAYMMYAMNGTATEAGLATLLHSIPGFILGAFVGGWIGKHQSVKMPVNFGGIVRLLVIGFFAFFLTPSMPIWVPIVVFSIGGLYTAMAGSLYTVGPQIILAAKHRATGIGIISMGQNLGSATATCVYGLLMSAYGIENGLHLAFTIAFVVVIINWLVMLPIKKETE
ncbi:MFS transporter [Tractidigestivibacter scatoligenes]|nr:MFS transporter [Tractidigestivibacter scatoligenes]